MAKSQPGNISYASATGIKRSNNMPDLPTMAESGVSGYDVYEWNVLVAPAGTPPAIISKLHGEVKNVLAMQDIRERIDALGGEVVASTPADTETFLGAQTGKWAKVVKQGNIQVD
jgi:tripartite-type tricarboxylate transporter receptor subunit TctC